MKQVLFLMALISFAVYAKETKTTQVIIETSVGDIEVELNSEKAPKSVENFLKYVDSGFYHGTIFHRVIKDFMIQGGGFDKDMQQKKTRDPIKNEANNGLKNEKGTLAMARTNDPHSATSQFFINTVDNEYLDFKSETPTGWGYAVFAKVTDGMSVVNRIQNAKTGNLSGHQNVPMDTITIKSIKRKK